MAQIVAQHLHLPMDLIVPEKRGSASFILTDTPVGESTTCLPSPANSRCPLPSPQAHSIQGHSRSCK